MYNIKLFKNGILSNILSRTFRAGSQLTIIYQNIANAMINSGIVYQNSLITLRYYLQKSFYAKTTVLSALHIAYKCLKYTISLKVSKWFQYSLSKGTDLRQLPFPPHIHFPKTPPGLARAR